MAGLYCNVVVIILQLIFFFLHSTKVAFPDSCTSFKTLTSVNIVDRKKWLKFMLVG